MFTLSMKHALIFHFKKPTAADLHMFFVLHPIDVLWLDEKRRVVDIEENLKPFTYRVAKKRAMFVIELDPGIIKTSKTKVGDVINF